mmetsp:Transcript_34107/g.50108  ORF Transcript_34107/g.50108 Transcript_34107/m.50108 type:complete len:124 (+) Transcript_34107:654-1025(+)
MEWAEAATPVLSMLCVALATARKVILIARFLSCNAAPPLNRGSNDAQEGSLKSLDHRIMFRFNRVRMKATAEITSAATVAKAAPPTPKPRRNINIGSNTALNMFAKRLILSGDSVSNVPRKAA